LHRINAHCPVFNWPPLRLAPLLLCLALALSGLQGAYAGTYDGWVQAHNLPSATSGPADAPAGDGIANLLKFALGLEPLTPGPRPLFEPILVNRDGQPLLGLRLTLASGAQGVRLNLSALAPTVLQR